MSAYRQARMIGAFAWALASVAAGCAPFTAEVEPEHVRVWQTDDGVPKVSLYSVSLSPETWMGAVFRKDNRLVGVWLRSRIPRALSCERLELYSGESAIPLAWSKPIQTQQRKGATFYELSAGVEYYDFHRWAFGPTPRIGICGAFLRLGQREILLVREFDEAARNL